jgi:hypothetical protein
LLAIKTTRTNAVVEPRVIDHLEETEGGATRVAREAIEVALAAGDGERLLRVNTLAPRLSTRYAGGR